MNTHDIIKMAREASGDDWGIFKHFMPEIERFAALVAAAEREACAKVSEINSDSDNPYCCSPLREQIAQDIRARGQG